MKLESINKLLQNAQEKYYDRLLFDFRFGNSLLKCLILTKNCVLMFANSKFSVGHSVSIDEHGCISGYLTNEFYNSIIDDIKHLYGDNKSLLFWKLLDEYLCNLNVDTIVTAPDSSVLSIVKTLKTNDRKCDPDGEKPFFETWVRNVKKHVSIENLNKTRRYFGSEITGFCRQNNISSRWNCNETRNALCFLNITNVREKLKQL